MIVFTWRPGETGHGNTDMAAIIWPGLVSGLSWVPEAMEVELTPGGPRV